MAKKHAHQYVQPQNERKSPYVEHAENGEMVMSSEPAIDPNNALVVAMGNNNFQIVDRFGVAEGNRTIVLKEKALQGVQWNENAEKKIGVMKFDFNG